EEFDGRGLHIADTIDRFAMVVADLVTNIEKAVIDGIAGCEAVDEMNQISRIELKRALTGDRYL
ncbi:MAG: hypothetical protein Q8J76_00390, partial [Desulfobulbaceae bacterium]|nr:hypothetical protein [Desulfobulbaceae bacterium]